MSFRLSELTAESIEDAVVYWLFSEEDGWERWRLVPDSPVLSPNRDRLRLTFESDGESFELALVQRGSRVFAKYDDHDDPQQELPSRVFVSDEGVVASFVHKDQTVFVHLELAG